MANSIQAEKNGIFIRFINTVERAGNKLPHPFFLFIYLGVIVLVLSFLMAGLSVTYTSASSGGAEMKETTIVVKNLLSSDYIKGILKNWTKIYVNFAPLGLVMVMMLAIGFAQDTGLFNAFMKKTLLGAPAFMVTFVLAIVGVCGNMASNAGVVLGATLGAALFSSLGRNPIIGALTGYAAAHGGFSANLFPSGTDVTLAGITQSAATGMHIQAPTHPLINYYFMIAATFVIAIAVTFVTERIMPKIVKHGGIQQQIDSKVTDMENRGLRYAAVGLVIFLVCMLALSVPEKAFFRAANGSLVPKSPLIDSIVAILFIFFVVVGSFFGIGAGTIKKMADVPKFMGNGIRDSISFCVIAFPAALFIQFFNDSKIANYIAVNGAEILEAFNFQGIPLAIAFVFLTIFCNLFMTSASSKWLFLAPIFVPMFYQLGFNPALTQVAYRIGDSVSNPIAPINYFLPIVLGIMNKYREEGDGEFGLGTLISYMLPYSMVLALVLISFMVFWMLLGIPLGPGAALFVK
ncbi:MAG: AbgT family transporter [Synergistaceae bacterium]|nr:AbgT family transporter [Synergistaceae bacterium]MDD3333299.1 AbgT family transporter [Proteiniphilum sp.]MDD3688728.1 AbgT family transporter [Synergistaceae bacterium]